MKIAIGSQNPVKIEAVKDGLSKAFPRSDFIPVEVESGVPDQPMGDDETTKGAINRAKRAVEATGADIGIGLEGGVVETDHGMMNTVWVAIVDGKGKISLGGGLHAHLPEQVAVKIRKGMELGRAMDEMTGKQNTKQKEGAIGILTKGLIDRKDAYESLVRLASTKFVSPEFFQ